MSNLNLINVVKMIAKIENIKLNTHKKINK